MRLVSVKNRFKKNTNKISNPILLNTAAASDDRPDGLAVTECGGGTSAQQQVHTYTHARVCATGTPRRCDYGGDDDDDEGDRAVYLYGRRSGGRCGNR